MGRKDSALIRILLAEYATATRHYAKAVGELNKHRAILTKDDYKRIYRLAEDAREDCERLRRPLPTWARSKTCDKSLPRSNCKARRIELD
jgi:hypothetical protein